MKLSYSCMMLHYGCDYECKYLSAIVCCMHQVRGQYINVIMPQVKR